MAKLTAWLVTVIGILMVLALIIPDTISLETPWVMWIVSLAVLVIGIGKLVRNYSTKRKKY